MRNELLVFSAFLFVVVALANDKPEKYEIELKEVSGQTTGTLNLLPLENQIFETMCRKNRPIGTH